MKRLTDDELIKELEERFAFNQKALEDLQNMTKKLEKMNSKLQESEALKSHFLSNIRNEINNPLTSIMGLSQQCLCNPSESERCTSVARMIYHEAFTLDFQLQNIFVAAELEAGEADPAFANVDVSTIIDRVVESQEFQISEKSMQIKADREKPLPLPVHQAVRH
jgi:signal transduction histidine kinase